jgi:predicted nucleotidyltransferase
MVRTKQEVIEISKKYALNVEKVLGPIELRLYGSYHKGKQTKESDIDLAIVSDIFDSIDHTVSLQILNRLKLDIDNRIEPISLTTSDLHTPKLGDISWEIKQASECIYTTPPLNVSQCLQYIK